MSVPNGSLDTVAWEHCYYMTLNGSNQKCLTVDYRDWKEFSDFIITQDGITKIDHINSQRLVYPKSSDEKFNDE